MKNTSRLQFYVILAALLLLVAGLVWFNTGSDPSSKVRTVQKHSAKERAKRPSHQPAPTPADNAVANPQSQVAEAGAIETASSLPLTLLVFFEDEISQINDQHELGLSSEQVAAFQKKYSEAVASRLKLEAGLAQITQTGDNSWTVVIPAYKEGIKLRDEISAHLDAVLASVGKARLAENIQFGLDIDNSQWGVTPQTIEFDYNSEFDYYDIKHFCDTLGEFPLDNENRATIVGRRMSGSSLKSSRLWHYSLLVNKIKDTKKE